MFSIKTIAIFVAFLSVACLLGAWLTWPVSTRPPGLSNAEIWLYDKLKSEISYEEGIGGVSLPMMRDFARDAASNGVDLLEFYKKIPKRSPVRAEAAYLLIAYDSEAYLAQNEDTSESVPDSEVDLWTWLISHEIKRTAEESLSDSTARRLGALIDRSDHPPALWWSVTDAYDRHGIEGVEPKCLKLLTYPRNPYGAAAASLLLGHNRRVKAATAYLLDCLEEGDPSLQYATVSHMVAHLYVPASLEAQMDALVNAPDETRFMTHLASTVQAAEEFLTQHAISD